MGLTYNETKYVYLCNKEFFKTLSLEDNVYFTLRDIFMNAENCDDAIECNQFNSKLTKGIGYEERTDTFTYANVLQDKDFVEELIQWLNQTKPSRDLFFTDKIDDDDDYSVSTRGLTSKWKYSPSDNINEYITLDAWMESFNDLKNNLLPKRLGELKNKI